MKLKLLMVMILMYLMALIENEIEDRANAMINSVKKNTNADKSYECPTYNTNSYKIKINYLERNVHSDTVNCNLCDKIFSSNISLNCHMKEIHRKDEGNNICFCCGIFFLPGRRSL